MGPAFDLNSGTLSTEGIDVSLAYRVEDVIPGTLQLNLDVTKVLSWNMSDLLLNGALISRGYDGVGFINAGNPQKNGGQLVSEYKAAAGFNYTVGRHNLNWRTTWRSALTVDAPLATTLKTAVNANVGTNAFALSSLGDAVYLFAGDASTNLTGYVHAATFGASANGVSFGRYVNSAGEEDFVAMSWLTLGSINSRPRVGPVVLSEIMFQPPLLGTNENYDAEFIELANITATNVPLYDVAFPTNTWRLRNAVDFDFPPNASVPGDGRVLVVGFNPATNATKTADFRTSYGVSNAVPIYGPWSGRLSNEGEAIELKLPDPPQQLDGFVPYVQVEKISYRAQAPWPTGAAGSRLGPTVPGWASASR